MRRTRLLLRPLAPVLTLALVGGCAADDPTPSQLDAGLADGRVACAANWTLDRLAGDAGACPPAADDFVPASDSDGYASCISDDGTYHRFDPSIGSIGRVAGFEKIVALLLKANGAPTPQDFIDARVTYAEPEGLESRIARRENEHVTAPAKACADMSADEIAQHADRCVGQAQLQPLLNDAFKKGAAGDAPLVHAARIEATLLWFLHVSIHKEATTCTAKQKDCDSSYAYYTGGEDPPGGLGLARYVRAVAPARHQRALEAVLALRCWRDIDSAEPATDITLRDRALAQLDRALDRGLAAVIAARLDALVTASCDDARDALWAGLQILGKGIDLRASAVDAARAKTLRDAFAAPAADADVPGIKTLLGDLFGCSSFR